MHGVKPGSLELTEPVKGQTLNDTEACQFKALRINDSDEMLKLTFRMS